MRPRKGKKKVLNDDDVSRTDVGMQYELTPVCERLVNIPKVKEAFQTEITKYYVLK